MKKLKETKEQLNFKLYLFYNNNTWLQIGNTVILLGWEQIRNIFWSGKTIVISSLDKENPILLKPKTSHSLSGCVHT